MSAKVPAVGERWSYKRDWGDELAVFTVADVIGHRVVLANFVGRLKTITVKTLRGDYERVS